MKKHTLLWYALALGGLMFLLHWLELRFIIIDHSIEVFTISVALLFTGLGSWLALKLVKPKEVTVTVEKEVVVLKDPVFEQNREELQKLGISKRELEVLHLMSAGLSNEEIADKLSLSVPTIKTHASRLFEKLDVKRRTQAEERARRLQIIP